MDRSTISQPIRFIPSARSANQIHSKRSAVVTVRSIISSIVSQMYQYCKTKRKTIVLQMDIRGKTNQKQLYALYADRDNENDLENLGEDSDTEFIPVTEEVREALITLDNNIECNNNT